MLSFQRFGELGRLYEETDWAATPLGPSSTWSSTLHGVVDQVLHTRFPVTIFWGPEFVMLYNEAYISMIGEKHPRALGARACEVFPEAWHLIGPMLTDVTEQQRANWVEDELVPLRRHGFLEECYFTFSYSPVCDLDGEAEGVMGIVTETTDQVVSRRRLWLLTRLNEALADTDDATEVPEAALPVLTAATRDLVEVDIVVGSAVTPPASITRGGTATFVLDGQDGGLTDTLVVRLSDRLPVDGDYLGFLRLIAASLRQALDRARIRAAERRTSELQRDMAEAFQRRLLPIPRAGSRPNVAVRYRAAAEEAQIGGDWYDLFRLPDGSLLVVIGDVAGHDQHSAAAMAQVRNMTRGVAYTLDDPSPAHVVRGIDRAVLGSSTDLIATGVVAQVLGGVGEPQRLRWSNAGHPPPVLIAPDGRAILLEQKPDLLLGLDAETDRAEHQIDLAEGSTVVLYTDGLVERRGVPIATGLEWLVELLQGCHTMPPEELCDYLLDAAAATEDDVALLVFRT